MSCLIRVTNAGRAATCREATLTIECSTQTGGTVPAVRCIPGHARKANHDSAARARRDARSLHQRLAAHGALTAAPIDVRGRDQGEHRRRRVGPWQFRDEHADWCEPRARRHCGLLPRLPQVGRPQRRPAAVGVGRLRSGRWTERARRGRHRRAGRNGIESRGLMVA